jgi:hypothetical protein
LCLSIQGEEGLSTSGHYLTGVIGGGAH